MTRTIATSALPVDPLNPFASPTESPGRDVRDALGWHAAGHVAVALALGQPVSTVVYGIQCPPLADGRDGALVAVGGPHVEQWAPGWRAGIVTFDCPGNAEPATFGRHRHGLTDELAEILGAYARQIDEIAATLQRTGELTSDALQAIWTRELPPLGRLAEANGADAQNAAAWLVHHRAVGDSTRAAASRRKLAALGYG